MAKKLNFKQGLKKGSDQGGLQDLDKVQVVKKEEEQEFLTAYIQVKVKPSEKERYAEILRGGSMSNQTRQLILDYIEKNEDK